MKEQYIRNIGPLTQDDQAQLSTKTVLIAGLGGLGGHLLEHMLRVGVGKIIAADGDVFNRSNLNRQLLCTESVIGRKKADIAAQRAAAVNPSVKVVAVPEFITQDNCFCLLQGCDLALDGLDNVPARLILADACSRRGIPLIHGGISGWCAQISVVPPNSGLLDRIYTSGDSQPLPNAGCISPLPALCAAIQAAQAICLLCGRPAPLWGKLLLVDLLHAEQALLPLLPDEEAYVPE